MKYSPAAPCRRGERAAFITGKGSGATLVSSPALTFPVTDTALVAAVWKFMGRERLCHPQCTTAEPGRAPAYSVFWSLPDCCRQLQRRRRLCVQICPQGVGADWTRQSDTVVSGGLLPPSHSEGPAGLRRYHAPLLHPEAAGDLPRITRRVSGNPLPSPSAFWRKEGWCPCVMQSVRESSPGRQ